MSKTNVSAVLEVLEIRYGEVATFLIHKNEFELLVAVILSAQATDVLVNKVTPKLFERFPKVEELADASYEEVAGIIRQVNYYKNKAKYIVEMARIVRDNYQGKVPRTMEELVRLPGVGRKVANVILAESFAIQNGVVVDTHVKRVAYRLGWTMNLSPEKVERDLIELLPEERRKNTAKQLILIGREYCYAGREPDCKNCPLNRLCPKKGVQGGNYVV
jgi:endonuclease-3